LRALVRGAAPVAAAGRRRFGARVLPPGQPGGPARAARPARARRRPAPGPAADRRQLRPAGTGDDDRAHLRRCGGDRAAVLASLRQPDGPGAGRVRAGRAGAGGQPARAGRGDPAVPVRRTVRQHPDAVPRAAGAIVPAAAAGAGLSGARVRGRVRGTVRMRGALRHAAQPRTGRSGLAVAPAAGLEPGQRAAGAGAVPGADAARAGQRRNRGRRAPAAARTPARESGPGRHRRRAAPDRAYPASTAGRSRQRLPPAARRGAQRARTRTAARQRPTDRPGRRQRRLPRRTRVPARVQALDRQHTERDARRAVNRHAGAAEAATCTVPGGGRGFRRSYGNRGVDQPATITASTSNAAPLGSAETSIVERAGYGWLKYSAITALTSANWPRLVRYSP